MLVKNDNCPDNPLDLRGKKIGQLALTDKHA